MCVKIGFGSDACLVSSARFSLTFNMPGNLNLKSEIIHQVIGAEKNRAWVWGFMLIWLGVGLCLMNASESASILLSFPLPWKSCKYSHSDQSCLTALPIAMPCYYTEALLVWWQGVAERGHSITWWPNLSLLGGLCPWAVTITHSSLSHSSLRWDKKEGGNWNHKVPFLRVEYGPGKDMFPGK